VAFVARALPSSEGGKRWNADADLNGDGNITLADLKIVIGWLLDPDCRRGD
jgi:hypothetical protein